VRAARLHQIGDVPRVDEIDDAQGSEVLEVSASSLNPVDIAIGGGRFYGGTPDTPYVIGSEAVGRTADGHRLWYPIRGTMAERVPLEQPDRAVEIPEGVDDGTAIACGIAGLTGWIAISWRAPVGPDDTVLVLGASGTLGATAVQGAKLLGAKRVVGAARRTEAVPDAADEVVGLDGDYELPEATVIVDALWGIPFERAIAVAARGVRVVQLGQSAGPTATLQSSSIRGNLTNILGLSVFMAPLEVIARGYRELCEHARDARIRFDVTTYPLDAIAEAWQRQATGSPGTKIVVEL